MAHMAELLYQIKQTNQVITDLFEERLGISLTRYQLLCQLLEVFPCSQQVLQEQLQIDRAAIARHIKLLEVGGYIERHRNPSNQREMVVSPSSKTIRELQLSPSPYHLAVQEAMEQILTEEEKHQLQALLDKVWNGLSQIPLDQ